MNISLSYYSGLGRRKNNEDSVSVLESPNGLLAIVADGLGGQDNGEYASRQAVKTLNDLLAHEPISSRKLTQAVLQANREIVSLQAGRPGAQTTIAAVWLGEGFAETAHVGIPGSISSGTTRSSISPRTTAWRSWASWRAT